MAVILSQRTDQDLGEILEFHSERDPVYAKALTDRLLDAALSLGRFPHRGAMSRGPTGYRRIFESGHVIVYAVIDNDVIIARILHASRDVETILSEES